MSNYSPTEDMIYDGASSADSVSFQLPGHSRTTPHFVIFDRKVPAARSTMAEYRIRVIQGFLDAEGARIDNRAVLECTNRIPLDGVGVAEAVKANIGRLAVMLADPAMVNQMVTSLILPR